MGEIADAFAETFRDYEVDGVPASGARRPHKDEARALGTAIEQKVRPAVIDEITDATTRAGIVAKTSTTPVQTEVQAAFDGAGDQSALDWTQGQYYLTSAAVIGNDRFSLRGDGPYATLIRFAPTGDAIALQATKGSDPIYALHISGLGFKSTVNTHVLTALYLSDVKGLILEDVVINDGDWPGAGSIGLHYFGRDMAEMRNLRLSCNRPVVFSPNPNYPTLCLDHLHVHSAELISDLSTGKCIDCEDGIVFTNTTFGPGLALVGGKYGLYWNDTTSGIASYGLVIRGLRTEQAADATGWSVYLKSTAQVLNDLLIEGFVLDPGRNGLYFENCKRITLRNGNFTASSGEHLHVVGQAGTVLVLENCFFEPGGTKTLTNMRRVFGLTPQQSSSALSEYEIWVYDDGVYGNRQPELFDNAKILGPYGVDVPHTGGSPQVHSTAIVAPPAGALIELSWSTGGGLVHFATDGTTTILSGSAELNTSGAGTCVQVTNLGSATFGFINKLASDDHFRIRALL